MEPRRATDTRPIERRFRWRRLVFALANEPTRQLEVGLALFFFMLRGLFLLRFGYSQTRVEAFLVEVHLSESLLGLLCVAGGLMHLYAAGTEWPRLRAVVALGGAGLAITVIVAFKGAEPEWHPVATVWLSVLVAEFFVMVRHYMTIRADKQLKRREQAARAAAREAER